MGIVIIVIAAGALLLILSSGSKNESEGAVLQNLERFDFAEYEEKLERRLEEKINSIEGISSCEVMVLVESSYVYDYLLDDNGSIVMSEIGGDETPVREKERAPQIKGVAVICKGAKSAQRKKEIIDMLSALLNIPTNNIWVGSKEQ